MVGAITELGSCGTTPTPAPSLFVDVDVDVDSGVEIELAAGGVSSLTEGTWSKAKRFLSDSATALRMSGRVTFKDLIFRQESCYHT